MPTSPLGTGFFYKRADVGIGPYVYGIFVL